MLDNPSLSQKLTLLELAQRIYQDSSLSPEGFLTDLIKKNDRVSIFSSTKIEARELIDRMKLTTNDINYFINNGLLTKLNDESYILTLLGALIGISILREDTRDVNELNVAFIKTVFTDRFSELIRKDEPLASEEKIWLFSMIFLNCFDINRSLDILNNKQNSEVYRIFFNQIGEFLMANGYLTKFKVLEPEVEYLRREIYRIDKKLVDVKFGKKRDELYIQVPEGLLGEKNLTRLLNCVFTKINGTQLNLNDVKLIGEFIDKNMSTFYKIRRKNQGLSESDSRVNKAINNLVAYSTFN